MHTKRQGGMTMEKRRCCSPSTPKYYNLKGGGRIQYYKPGIRGLMFRCKRCRAAILVVGVTKKKPLHYPLCPTCYFKGVGEK